MRTDYGVLIVSHVEGVAKGVHQLMSEIGPNVSITYSGGTEEGGVGTSFESILNAVDTNQADKILAFYDLGSAKMNLDIVSEMTDKSVTIYDAAFVEGCYTACALLEAGVDLNEIESQLKPLIIK
ncbi:PTS-dependent dihydroxyacetone kinase phosphotransferase subunit DhaM [Erysipelothrix inopinata]|uniref:phosphoenolpyruvate--glycerone phosphotransferase n=1 Tax=Erysipelothrix inopinata TaxID=225084 RepID=A0A7G9RY82_9FIRM|nr:dihydroxyacetone kinase phosphoryl donor subunit DhaM [Erysipelothrix inopinata]QNN60557.1 PTS-dependent dihydroxyacetone kinase phosphotransferase subunit DhaM [Erysipelothrix inopinata]